MLNKMKIYNQLIERYNKAEKFFDDGNITFEKKLEHVEKLQELVNKIGLLIKDIENNGYKMNSNEVINGFNQIKFLKL